MVPSQDRSNVKLAKKAQQGNIWTDTPSGAYVCKKALLKFSKPELCLQQQ